MSACTIWWIRHGPTHQKGVVGWSDVGVDLSDTAALARLSNFLPEAPVVSSDLIRARETADAIQGTRPRLPDEPGLREIHFGDWELMSAREIGAAHPDLSRAYWTDPDSCAPPGGEHWQDLTARVGTVVDRLAREPDLIAVAHFGVILSQLRRALGVSVADVMAHRIDNLSVTEIRVDPDGWRAGRINHRP